ncbi:MAG TPA: ferredoxin reductase family protein, partial [Acidimicrobiales bacterium]|nr:ferredoxin reductase family protein [Acidimicrobiales bacterium]
LTGLAGAYLLLVMVLLMARIPALERAVGQDRLVRWHRRLGAWPIGLLVAHALLITVGYAQGARTGLLHQAYLLIRSYPDVLAAVVGLGLILMAGVTSIRYARSRMRYETWWAIHLYTYLALALSFAHQIANGASFVGHPLATLVWSVVWASTAGVVILFRIGLPLWRTLFHSLRIVSVTPEGPGVVSIVCAGRAVDRLALAGGQFFFWRFLTPGLWWHAHPYSVSALPRPPYLRVTIKGLGDHSAAIARLRPGTRVAIEGPYGAFTRHAATSPKFLLVAAGVGVTPVRALLEDLPSGADVSVVLRASSPEAMTLRSEMAALVEARSGHLHELYGDRHQVVIDPHALKDMVPDIAERDLYVCGPPGFTERVVRSAAILGVPARQIHHEEFSF